MVQAAMGTWNVGRTWVGSAHSSGSAVLHAADAASGAAVQWCSGAAAAGSAPARDTNQTGPETLAAVDVPRCLLNGCSRFPR